MAGQTKTTGQLPVLTGVSSNDRLVAIGNTAGNAQTATISITNLASNTYGFPVLILGSSPANSGALTVTGGSLYTDGVNLYISPANNVLRKLQANLSTGAITLVAF